MKQADYTAFGNGSRQSLVVSLDGRAFDPPLREWCDRGRSILRRPRQRAKPRTIGRRTRAWVVPAARCGLGQANPVLGGWVASILGLGSMINPGVHACTGRPARVAFAVRAQAGPVQRLTVR